MSILIRDMEMPKNCGDCLTNYMLNVVCDCDLNNIEDGRRMPNCQLVEIPTPHGRLIDADKIEYEKLYIDDVGKSYEMVGKDDIDDAETVIEAEGSET